MFQKLKIAALSAIISLGTLAAIPATAQADSLYIGIGAYGASFGYHDAGYRHGPRWARRACSARQALNKASRMGIHRAHIRRMNRNTIRVDGRRRGNHAHVVFATAPHCPVIRYR